MFSVESDVRSEGVVFVVAKLWFLWLRRHVYLNEGWAFGCKGFFQRAGGFFQRARTFISRCPRLISSTTARHVFQV